MENITATELRESTAHQLDRVQHKGAGLHVTRGGKTAGLMLPLLPTDVPLLILTLRDAEASATRGATGYQLDPLRRILDALEAAI